jgi:putative NADH-flavin reductase
MLSDQQWKRIDEPPDRSRINGLQGERWFCTEQEVSLPVGEKRRSRLRPLIKDSALDWTIVRPGLLTNGRRTGRYKVLKEPSQWRNGTIARADVADFLVEQIEDRAYVGKTPVLVY